MESHRTSPRMPPIAKAAGDDNMGKEGFPNLRETPNSKAELSLMTANSKELSAMMKLVVLPEVTESRGLTDLDLGDEDPPQDAEEDTCGNSYIMSERNVFRLIWSFATALLLVYIATVYLYHFSFYTFHIEAPEGSEPCTTAEQAEDDLFGNFTTKPTSEESQDELSFWKVMDYIVEVTFIMDIFVNFFVSFKDNRGTEIFSLRLVAKKYLCSNFLLDVIACIPESVGKAMVELINPSDTDSESNSHQTPLKLVKLQRMQRLTRLIRLTRVARCIMSRGQNPFQKWLQSFRGVRIVNFLCCLVWTVHVMACGWYITAALHEKAENTWVARRYVNPNECLLLHQPPFEQWLHSMYFVLTVFTTVGFGDMSAGTEAEILYVALVMVVGAVVHSIVISEVITIVTTTDRVSQFKDIQFKVVEAFACHTQLPDTAVDHMKAEITYRANYLMENNQDKGDMVKLVTGKFFPRWFIGTLPDHLFRGRLKEHHFLTRAQELTSCQDFVPPSLVCLLAVHLNQCEYGFGEVVYQKLDFPFHLYLVLKGSFANVAIPSSSGGIDVAARELNSDMGHQPSSQSENTGMRTADMQEHATWTEQSGIIDPRVPAADEHTQVYPYRSYSYNNFFGDLELQGDPRPRCSTVRCEAPHSLCLVLAKDDFTSICEQFPQYARPWRVLGRRRNWYRIRQRSELRHGLSLKGLSVLRIQRRWRMTRHKHPGIRNSEPPGRITSRWDSHRPDLVLSVQPKSADRSPNTSHIQAQVNDATCARNGKCCEDINALRRDIKELKDTMKLMVKEVAALSSIIKSTRNGGASTQDPGLEFV